MAVKRSVSRGLPLLHLLMRFLGLTGLVAAGVGAFIWFVLDDEDIGKIVVIGAAVAVGLAALFEVKGLLRAMSSRRGAVGGNVILQIVLAIAVVVVLNAISFQFWHMKFDWTRGHDFTLPRKVREHLAQLQGTTDIYVLQQYVSFGQGADNKEDKYDLAAQQKIVDKVKDLAEQFQDLGPRFRLQVLDIKDDNYLDKLQTIEKESPKLADAIKHAPENSIFFYAEDRKQLQRLSFSDLYELDKKASNDANDGKGNLVLKFQGVEGFARKIFNIEEKKPRIATAIIHPWLGLQNREHAMFTMNGAKKVLDNYGFDYTDIILKKLDPEGDLTNEPTALSYEESRFEQIEDSLAEMDESKKAMEKQQQELDELYKFWNEKSLPDLNKKYVYFYLEDGRQGVMQRSQIESLKKSGIRHKLIDVDEEDRRIRTTAYKRDLEVLKSVMEAEREERANMLKEKGTLRADRLAEKRRITDVEAKMKDMLANVDLLIVPRITLMNAPRGMRVPNRVHKLDAAQLKAIKAFMAVGKPVLFLLGPTNEPSEVPDRDPDGADQLETALAELGFRLPKQTILYNVESKEYNDRKVGVVFSNREIEVPGLRFDNATETGMRGKTKGVLVPHPIRGSLTVTSRSAGSRDSYEVRVRHPRPVYFMRAGISPEGAAGVAASLAVPDFIGRFEAAAAWIANSAPKPDEDAVFLMTREESWNEDNPFISKSHVPRFVPPQDNDAKRGSIEEARRGPFPIGAAAETTVPSSWYDNDEAKPQKVRVAVIGSGGMFVGPSLPPLKEKMLLDVVDWLLGRDDLLAKDAGTWQYPRVHMSDTAFSLWNWGTRLGFPVFFIYLGTVIWLVRRMR